MKSFKEWYEDECFDSMSKYDIAERLYNALNKIDIYESEFTYNYVEDTSGESDDAMIEPCSTCMNRDGDVGLEPCVSCTVIDY